MNIEEYISIGESEKPLDRIVTDGGFCSIFRTIGCIGDSLSSGEFEAKNEKGEKTFHDFFEYSWGQFIARSSGSTVYNFSRGGMTAKEYMESFAQSKGFWNRDKLCQAYIIALGVNDIRGIEMGTADDVDLQDYRKNIPSFAGYYAQIIQRLKTMQPRAHFFLVSMPRDGNEDDVRKRAHRDLLESFTHIFEKTYLIDLYTYAPIYDKEFRKKYFLGHMTPTGYVLTARMIESYIDYIIRKNPQKFLQVGFIGTDLYYQPE